MRKLALAAFGFLLGFGIGWIAPAFAVVPFTTVGDSAYAILITDTNIRTTTAFTAARVWTLPSAGGTCIGQNCTPASNTLQIIDAAGAITYQNTLTITPASGETINGNTGSITLSAAGARISLSPTTGSNWQVVDTSGDFQTTGVCVGTGSTATITVTIAAPGVVTDTAHGLTGACPVVFTTNGALPTGITSGTTYWVVPSTITTNTYQLATSVSNALAGTALTTSGSQSGTQTRTGGSPLASTTAANVTGLALTQGDWECRATVSHNLAASTSVTLSNGSISQTSATVSTQGGNSNQIVSTAANVMGVAGQDLKVGLDREKLAATTNLYLVARDTFSVSTNGAYGNLTCRRVG